MRSLVPFLMPFCLHSCSATQPGGEASVNRVSAYAGARSLSDDDVWGEVSDEAVFGLQFSHVGKSGFGFELGGFGSGGYESRDGANLQVLGAVAEVFAGVLKEFGQGRWHPYLGAGGAFLAAGIDNDSGGGVADEEDVSPAYYAHGGVLYDLSESVFFGVDVRTLGGSDLSFGPLEGDADYTQVTLVLGVSF